MKDLDIINYLDDLDIQKKALADNLVTKGVEATQDEKFNTLVPKVLNIQGGGAGGLNLELEDFFVANPSYLYSYCGSFRYSNISFENLKKIFAENGKPCKTNFVGTFADCSNLITIPLLNTSLVQGFYQCFYNSRQLEIVPEIDLGGARNYTVWGKHTGYYAMMDHCSALKQFNAKNICAHLDLSESPLLTKEALHTICTNLVDIGEPLQLKLERTVITKLAPEDKQLAESKGWTIS